MLRKWPNASQVVENGKIIRRHRNFDTLAEQKMAAAVFVIIPICILGGIIATWYWGFLLGKSIQLNIYLLRKERGCFVDYLLVYLSVFLFACLFVISFIFFFNPCCQGFLWLLSPFRL